MSATLMSIVFTIAIMVFKYTRMEHVKRFPSSWQQHIIYNASAISHTLLHVQLPVSG